MKPTNASMLLPKQSSVRVQTKKQDIGAQQRQLTGWCWGLSLVLIASLGVMRSAQAEVSNYRADIFVPNSSFFAGQGSALFNQHGWLSNMGRGLDNDALLQVANNVRANNMSSAQRALNYQWLGQQHDKRIEHDNDAVSALLKLGLKSFWEQITEKQLKSLPDRGSFRVKQHNFDYSLKLSSRNFGITLNYEF